ncbi:MAG: ATP-binding protein [Renibacterium sp.]|nr:ATP-binding protein [Renibacterium sp.]
MNAVGELDAHHLLSRVAIVEQRVRALLAERRADDPNPGDPYRGLYLSEEHLARLLARVAGQSADSGVRGRFAELDRESQDCDARFRAMAAAAGTGLALDRLVANFDLAAPEVELLLIAVAADIDPRFESFFGYLNDDVTRRRPSSAVAIELCGCLLSDPGVRNRLIDGPLVRGGLLGLSDPDRPFPGRALQVPDRVIGYLLGGKELEPALAPVLAEVPALDWGDPADLAAALRSGAGLAYLREQPTGSGTVLARGALRARGLGTLAVDGVRLAGASGKTELARAAAREARLSDAGLVVTNVQALDGDRGLFAALDCAPMPLILTGTAAWDPEWLDAPPWQGAVPAMSSRERAEQWQQYLAHDGGADLAEDLDLAEATALFRLRPEHIARASRTALAQSRSNPGSRLSAGHLALGARAENGAALDKLARRIEPGVGWNDLVLPPPVRSALQEVELRAVYRDRVLGDWGMRPGAGRGRGVAALFAGDSGTGKTMSAEVIAGALGLDLYVVDLSTVVDKYVGETEKNLERIFSAAAGVNGVLLFDEADAIFGKRSDVKDAHDRYANIESAYLLQRMESFDGLAILSTNLRANIDDAFTRRLDVLIDFPMPDAKHRSLLWDRCLGSRLRRAGRLDLDFMGAAFELSGGAIRSAAVTAAYLAAHDDAALGMGHLVNAVHGEYRKMGRLTVESEFRPYWHLVRPAEWRSDEIRKVEETG